MINDLLMKYNLISNIEQDNDKEKIKKKIIKILKTIIRSFINNKGLGFKKLINFIYQFFLSKRIDILEGINNLNFVYEDFKITNNSQKNNLESDDERYILENETPTKENDQKENIKNNISYDEIYILDNETPRKENKKKKNIKRNINKVYKNNKSKNQMNKNLNNNKKDNKKDFESKNNIFETSEKRLTRNSTKKMNIEIDKIIPSFLNKKHKKIK